MSDEQQAEWFNLQSMDAESFIVAKKSKFNVDELHPEAQRRLQMLGLVTINENEEAQDATDEEIDAILHKPVENENPDILADKYMMRNGVYELFKKLTAKIVLDRPVDPIHFMINDLEKHAKDNRKA